MMLPATVWLHDKTNSSAKTAKWCGGNLDISSSSVGGEQCGNTNIMEQIHGTAIPATSSPLCALHCSAGNQDLGDRQDFVYIGYL